MKKGLSAAGAAAVVAMLANTVSAAEGMKEGQWSMTMTIQADGMGEEGAKAMQEMEQMPPEQKAMMQQMMGRMKMGVAAQGMGMAITSSQCMTNAHPVPQRDDEKDCQETHAIKGNAVHFDVVCDDSRSSGEVTYDNDSMTGHIKSTRREHGRETTSTIGIRGQYEGPCHSGS